MVDPSKSFCLQWDKFTASCSGTFRSLLENEEFSDVTLYCGGKFLRCHRVILSASSQFFKTLLQNVKQPSALIAVPNIELPLLEAIIRFIYTGEVTIASHQLDALVKTGEMLKVNGLGDEEAIEDTEENIADSAFRPPVKRRRTEKVNNIQNIPAVPEEEPLVRSDEVLTVSGSSVKQETSFAENPDVNEARNIEDYDEKLLEGFGENSLNASGAEAYDETSLCMDPLEGSTSRQAENEREDGLSYDQLEMLISDGIVKKKGVLKPEHLSALSKLKVCLACRKDLRLRDRARRFDHYVVQHPILILVKPIMNCDKCAFRCQTHQTMRLHERKHEEAAYMYGGSNMIKGKRGPLSKKGNAGTNV